MTSIVIGAASRSVRDRSSPENAAELPSTLPLPALRKQFGPRPTGVIVLKVKALQEPVNSKHLAAHDGASATLAFGAVAALGDLIFGADTVVA